MRGIFLFLNTFEQPGAVISGNVENKQDNKVGNKKAQRVY